MMRDSNYEAVWCAGDCDTLCRVRVTIADGLGGVYYCEDCRDEAPENHPQSPEFEGHWEP